MTGRIGGQRAAKDAPSIEACGSLDELNAVLGLVLSCPLPEKIDAILRSVQDDLFAIGVEIATPEGVDKPRKIKDENVRLLEESIDSFEDGLPTLKKFILPGGSIQGAAMHWARTVVRRAERRCVRLSHVEKIDPLILRYLNRLSDLCFVMARYANLQQSVPEEPPDFDKRRD